MVNLKCSPYLGIRKNKLGISNIEDATTFTQLDTTALDFKKSDIKLPTELTLNLAEEIGIHIGDGHLSAKRYRYKLFGNQDESEYYEDFMVALYQRLYNIRVRLEKRERDGNIIGFEFSSKPIWTFKTKIIGLVAGRKDNITIPNLILSNSNVWRAFLRGLFDTDGNLYFQSRYGYKNYYPVISLSSKSLELCKTACELLVKLGFKANYYTARNEAGIQLYGYENLLKYANEIGWHNTKQLNRFLEWKKRFPNLVEKRAAIGIRTRSESSTGLHAAVTL